MASTDCRALLADLTSGNDDRAESAAVALGRLGERSLPAVQELLLHPVADVRWWATRTLGAMDSAAAMHALIGQCEDADVDVRACAIYALGMFGDRAEHAVPTLMQRLADPSVYVRVGTA